MLDLSHKKMIVWDKGIQLIKEVYRITDSFPSEEKFGLVSQLRRASVSIISNISEGEARKTKKEKRRFYEISCASLVEIDAQIEISLELGFISKKEVRKLSELLNECFAMLSKLKTSR
ncbi:four helix bundle protein [Fodinibius sp.]|uniref:four helix bundle protein n=1 Tax=Fodinibius sp. TaxID=1872440 RepID=UPI002ACDE215|nr:four helix bundle protein [Fodinibius sp.]MDZ7660344.1 four helix bundle protein [Fodinibius sp.]